MNMKKIENSISLKETSKITNAENKNKIIEIFTVRYGLFMAGLRLSAMLSTNAILKKI
jgi:hypothetical protein